MADQFWGRFKTIQVSIGIALVGHIILIVSALPPVIVHPNGAIAAFAIGIVIMGIGVGGFKSNISPLVAEQCKLCPKSYHSRSKIDSQRYRD
jgi:POT family proton-dependent oligopeptide transporter